MTKPRGVAKPVGRPPLGKDREELTSITFKADGETLAAIRELEATMTDGEHVARARSAAIRKALIETAARRRHGLARTRD
jgi:hypothetical protein